MFEIARFYTYTELTELLDSVAESHPNLVSVHSIGQTLEGREIWCATVADRSGGSALCDRHAMMVIANQHCVELAGSCQSLYLLRHLTENPEDDPAVTSLLRQRVVYIIPRLAIDGAEVVLSTGNRTRTRSRFMDVYEPNVLYPKDLTGDGRILSMRWPDPCGQWKACESDPRLMLPRTREDRQGPFYTYDIEGLIHDWDGGAVRPSTARCDFVRNYPESGWHPIPHMRGHGRYPLSEPETRAVADFVLAHPNICSLVDFHTGNPAIFYPYPVDHQPWYGRDLELLKRIGERGQATTGSPVLSRYTEARTGQPGKAFPGNLVTWAYEATGMAAFNCEMGLFYNSLGFETAEMAMLDGKLNRRSGLALLDWHDRHPQAGLFNDWIPFDHPQLGRVEIGGWDGIMYANPPLEQMETICSRFTTFLMELSSYTPDMRIDAFESDPVAEQTYLVRVTVSNHGAMSTQLTEQGQFAMPHSHATVELLGDASLQCLNGRLRRALEDLPAAGGSQQFEWLVRTEAPSEIRVCMHSPRGGRVDLQLDTTAPVSR